MLVCDSFIMSPVRCVCGTGSTYSYGCECYSLHPVKFSSVCLVTSWCVPYACMMRMSGAVFSLGHIDVRVVLQC